MKYVTATLMFFMILGFFIACSQNGETEPKKDFGYDYLIEMPEFMHDYPDLGSDEVGVQWEWWSKDGEIRVAHSIALFPREVMAAADTLNQAIEAYRGERVQNYFLMEMSPEFSRVGEDKYLYEKKQGNDWWLAIAEETANRKCTVAVFWVHGANQSELRDIELAIKSGRFGRYDLAFHNGCRERKAEMRRLQNGRLVIELPKGGDIICEDRKVSISEITEISREWVRRCKLVRSSYRLHLRADKKRQTADIKAVVKAAAEGGLKDVIFGALSGSNLSKTEPYILMAHSLPLNELLELVKNDPEAAAKKAEIWREGPARNRALIRVAEQWAQYVDPVAAAAWVETLPEGEAKRTALQRVTSYLIKKDLQATIDWSENLSKNNARTVKSYIAYDWVSRDPKATVSWVESWIDVDAKNRELWLLAHRWAGNAPKEAAVWVDSWADGEAKNRALVEVAGRWSSRWKSKDAVAAATWVDSWPDGETKNRALKRVVSNWAHNDYKGVAAWIDRWPEGEVKNESLIMVAGKVDYYQPQWVVTWVKGWMDEEYKHRAYMNLTSEWARKDPVATAVWAEKLPEGKTKIAVYKSLAGRWPYKKGAKVVSEWVEKLPDGANKLAAVQGLIMKWAFYNDMEEVELWVKGLPEGEIKYEALKEVAKSKAIIKNMPTTVE